MPPFGTPIATVDIALLTLSEGRLCAMLAKRPDDAEVFPGALSLPGDSIREDEDDDTESCAARVLRTRAGVVAPYLEQFHAFSGKYRDPRGWSLSVAYFALLPAAALAGKAIRLIPVDALPALPFDHARIVAAAVRRLRGKSAYSPLPAFLLPPKFTFDELHCVYRQALGVELNKVSFRRNIESQGIVTPIPGEKQYGAHRPAQLYRVADATLKEFDAVLSP